MRVKNSDSACQITISIVFIGKQEYIIIKMKRVIIITVMTIERAVDNAIASTEMEGFTITDVQRG